MGQTGTLPLVATPLYEVLGNSAATRQAAYRQFVDTPQPYDRSMREKLKHVTAYA
jgi:hypothetical protein